MDNAPIGRLVRGLAATMAVLGGVALIAATLITGLSVIGRALIPVGLSAIPGDVELVQGTVFFAVMAFMPWCHLERGQAIVAILTDRFPTRFNAMLEFLWDVAMLVAVAFITWRLWYGLLDKIGNKESTFILRIPLWIIYTGGLIGAVVFVIVALYCAVRSGANAMSANPVKPVSESGE